MNYLKHRSSYKTFCNVFYLVLIYKKTPLKILICSVFTYYLEAVIRNSFKKVAYYTKYRITQFVY